MPRERCSLASRIPKAATGSAAGELDFASAPVVEAPPAPPQMDFDEDDEEDADGGGIEDADFVDVDEEAPDEEN